MSLMDTRPDGSGGGPSTPTLDAATLRRVLGHFCSGLTVITAVVDDEPVGFTCQSFSSLSLDPPLVSFSVARSSTSWPRIRSASSFCVNVLAAGQAALSTAFARSGADKFAGVEWKPSGHGAPVLDGAVAVADVTTWAEYDGGDHVIVAARVLDLAVGSGGDPLLFFRGTYGSRWAA